MPRFPTWPTWASFSIRRGWRRSTPTRGLAYRSGKPSLPSWHWRPFRSPCWHARRRRPAVLVGWFWYLGMLVPVIGLVQVASQAMADRYTYLPQIGLCIAVAWGAAQAVAPWPISPLGVRRQFRLDVGGSDGMCAGDRRPIGVTAWHYGTTPSTAPWRIVMPSTASVVR